MVVWRKSAGLQGWKWIKGVLTIYMEKPKILVGKSNGTALFHLESLRNYRLLGLVTHFFHSS